MRTIPYNVYTGEENMQIDKNLLEDAIKKNSLEPTFRLYGWKPKCVSIGRNQKENCINESALKSLKIDTVRRLTGGRALLHDNEITYSYVCPISSLYNGESVIDSYKQISQILIEKFEKLGIKLNFGNQRHTNHNIKYCMRIATGADLCYKNKKLIGSAQFRKNGYILQHGSILFDYDKELLENVFDEEINTDDMTCIKEIDSNIKIDDIIGLWG
ncbi:lipoate--protein ligase family protein [bacterium]|nr:lipoate--protein ligase family protein [bacterium]